MHITPRYLTGQVNRDLKKKMVFLAGPRQVGKTTLSRGLPGADEGYLNWDVVEHREHILKRELPVSGLWIFDEIHKYRQWRNYLKGLYDNRRPEQQILVTGSGRLDLYRYGGDSLQGRYHMLRLHPFTASELGFETNSQLLELLSLGGFPEPFLGSSKTEARRWSREYRTRLIREEVMTLERVQDLGQLELLMLRLPELVGSPLSINAIREDLQISHKTASSWLDIMERLYAIFRLAPIGGPKIRAVKKERKHYHFDWSVIEDDAARYENLVACHLLKWVHYRQDVEGLDYELNYFRDNDGREVDFVITERRHPRMIIECKWTDRDIDRSLRYLSAKFPEAEAWQLTAVGRKDYVSDTGIRVSPAVNFLKNLV